MKVADLQQHLADLAKLLTVAGARGSGSELEEFQKGLEPYREHTLKRFAAFLEEASKPTDPNTKDRELHKKIKGGTSSADLPAIIAEVKRLWENASTVSYAEIEHGMAKLPGLTSAGLVAVATAIGLKGMSGKKKEFVLQAIATRVKGIKGTDDRSKMYQPPTAKEAKDHPETLGNNTPESISGKNP